MSQTKTRTTRTARRSTPGVCRFCGCTEEAACYPSCSWADSTRTACDRCAPGAHVLQELFRCVCGDPKYRPPSLAALRAWNLDQRAEARAYLVAALHRYAAGNAVRVPRRPAFLRGLV